MSEQRNVITKMIWAFRVFVQRSNSGPESCPPHLAQTLNPARYFGHMRGRSADISDRSMGVRCVFRLLCINSRLWKGSS